MALKNKIAFVTGGSRGIGRAIVLALKKEVIKTSFILTQIDANQTQIYADKDSNLRLLACYLRESALRKLKLCN